MKGLYNGEPDCMVTMGQHRKSASEEKSYSHVSCVKIIAPKFSFSHQISLLLLLVDMYWTEKSIFASKWDWIKESRCMRHCSFPFSTLWLFISFSILIINGANLQPVLFFSSSLFYVAHYSLFLCNHKRIALLLLCSVPYSFQWYRVLYTSILPDFPCCWRTPLCAAPSILLLCLQRYG